VNDEIFNHILKVEGGYVFHPDDRGGPTNYGITIKTYSEYLCRPVEKEEMKELTPEIAKDIYKRLYWDKLNLDELHYDTMALVIFDQAVNRGVRAAAKQAQLVLSKFKKVLLLDGIFGPETIRLLNEVPFYEFNREFLQESELFYIKFALGNPDQMKFLVGWVNRVHILQDMVLKGATEKEVIVSQKPMSA
jgi:lysozyme family protein